jgi:hypothetical protein
MWAVAPKDKKRKTLRLYFLLFKFLINYFSFRRTVDIATSLLGGTSAAVWHHLPVHSIMSITE